MSQLDESIERLARKVARNSALPESDDPVTTLQNCFSVLRRRLAEAETARERLERENEEVHGKIRGHEREEALARSKSALAEKKVLETQSALDGVSVELKKAREENKKLILNFESIQSLCQHPQMTISDFREANKAVVKVCKKARGVA